MRGKQEKGVSLIITFFVMTIIIAVVVSVSAILYSEIKIIRNVGYSVVSFYAADSGIEKALYYDRKEKPEGANRGLCNICNNVCPQSPSDPSLACICPVDWQTGSDCDPMTCSDCTIKFSTDMDSLKTYDINAVVSQQCKLSAGTMSSSGIFQRVARAIQLDLSAKATIGVAPTIEGQVCSPNGVSGYKFEADISDDDSEVEVFALITGYGDENVPGPKCTVACTAPYPTNKCCYREIEMEPSFTGSTHYISNPWNYYINGEDYIIKIMATDSDGNCVEVTACAITN